MLEKFVPSSFCREYVDVKGDSSQIVNFMATVLGHKPLMDDWIAVDRLEAYRAVCAQYGLHLEAESIFVMADKARLPSRVVDGESLTTTTAYGMPATARPPRQGWASLGARAHVFVARDRDLLRHGMWYPLVIRDRVVWPPRADLLSYGRYLGYPPCCIAFFQKYNNWRKYSFLWEIRRRSRVLHPLCNPLPKDRTYSYIYHMPCSFSCAATVARVTALRAAIAAHEPRLVEAIDRHLRLPTLVLRERKMYFFEGTLQGNRIDYHHFEFERSEPAADVLGAALTQGDAVEVDGQVVRVFAGTREITALTCHKQGFGPEIPFVIQFQ